ncbi:CDGSH iron-sulfur domain-containing protein [Streptomyces sp. NPDC048448]|uniref:CDGSH iron-sulfur domain-containing protein n=1 Tax=Streptomyces sp. NPDC048448 TaxID=3365554 RepID=UPI00371F1CD3
MPKHSDTAPAGRTTCRARRVSVDPLGPVLVEGPVEIVLDDGTVARSERFMVAICTCRRSRTYPWCDTSHRPREKTAGVPTPHERSQQAHDGNDGPATRPAPDDRNSP